MIFGVNGAFSKTLLTELLSDIDLLVAKAREGLKGKTGSPAVRHFLQEVKDKVKRMIVKIEDKETRVLAESVATKIEEALKDGSFGDIEDKVRAAIKANPLFPEKIGIIGGTERYAEGPYMRDMYPDRCVVSYEGRLYEMEYSIMKDAVIMGAPREVIEKYIPVIEAAKVKPLTEAKVTDLRESGVTKDLEVSAFVSLKEAKFNADFSEVEVVLIEQGVNEGKKRYYPDKTIREAAPIFAGMKMYINHPTPTEERERPERNLKDWASTIVESRYENGMAMGKIAIHDTWLRERLADPVARGQIGLSILAGGKISVGKVNGKDGYQIIEAIIPVRKNGPPSVDWVTEAGARGRVSKLLETRYAGGKTMEISELSLKELRESRPDLVEAIGKEHAQSKAQIDAQAKKDQELKEANEKIAVFEKKQKIDAQNTAIEAALREAKIPDVSKARIKEQFSAAIVEGDLKEAIAGAIKKELEYVNQLSSKGKIQTSEAAGIDIKESLGAELDARAGFKEPEKK